MAKFFVLLAVCFFVQASYARDVAEAFNVNIREQLNVYDKLQKEPESAKYIDDIKKLVEITERALKANSIDEKNQILSSAPKNFLPEFKNWISRKVAETQLNIKIQNSIEFYQSLLKDHAEHEVEIKKALTTLEKLLKENNLKQRKEKFFALYKTFSANFQKFLAERDLPVVNRHLEEADAFLKSLLNDKDNTFTKEIQKLKQKTEAALANNVSIDEKSKVLHEVRLTGNKALDAFLYKKYTERS